MIGDLISAGTKILGGFLGKLEADKQRDMQKQFAKNSIRWRVNDANKAGVHPLYALGAPTMSFAPQEIGQVGNAIADAGQDISRAMDQTSTTSQKAANFASQLGALQLQRAGLENELLSAQIATLRQTPQPPAPNINGDRFIVPGQANSGVVASGKIQVSPMRVDTTAAGNLSQEPMSISDSGYTRTPTGWAPVMSKDAKERLEEDTVGTLGWNLRNRLIPTLGSFDNLGQNPPSHVKLPPGKMWVYAPEKQEYQMVDIPIILPWNPPYTDAMGGSY